MICLVYLSLALAGVAAQEQRGPGQEKLHSLADEASFLAKHHPRVLQPLLGWHDASADGRRLHNVDSIPGQGACQFIDGKCIVDGKYFAKVGAVADFTTSIQDLDLCTSFDNFDGSCNDFVNPPGVCKTVSMGPALGGLACVPVNSSADGMDFQTGFSIRKDFGSLSAFLTEDCTEASVLAKTNAPACLPVWAALLRILGCDTCLAEIEAVRGPVAASCAVHTTLDTCISENATAAARFVLCGPDPACASVSPNTIDNPLDIFYNSDYFDYGDDADSPSPADYSSGSYDYGADAPGVPSSDEGADGVLEGSGEGAGDYVADEGADGDLEGGYDYGAGASAPGVPSADEGADGVLEGSVEGTGDYGYDYGAAPAPADYGSVGYDYGDAPSPAGDYAAYAYAPYVPFDYSADPPDVRDVLEGYLAATGVDYGDISEYIALPISADAEIFYGDEVFELAPGNPWEGSAEAGAAAPVEVALPEDLKNVTVGEIPGGTVL